MKGKSTGPSLNKNAVDDTPMYKEALKLNKPKKNDDDYNSGDELWGDKPPRVNNNLLGGGFSKKKAVEKPKEVIEIEEDVIPFQAIKKIKAHDSKPFNQKPKITDHFEIQQQPGAGPKKYVTDDSIMDRFPPSTVLDQKPNKSPLSIAVDVKKQRSILDAKPVKRAEEPTHFDTSSALKQWTKEAFELREQTERDPPENPYSFFKNKQVLVNDGEEAPKTDFTEQGHQYKMRGKNKNEQVAIVVSASKMLDWYNKMTYSKMSLENNSRYVTFIKDALARNIILYLVDFYQHMQLQSDRRRILTYRERLNHYEDLGKRLEARWRTGKTSMMPLYEGTIPFELIGGGIIDALELWLISTNPMETEPEFSEHQHMQAFYLLVHLTLLDEDLVYVGEHVKALARLIKLKKDAFDLLEEMRLKKPADEQGEKPTGELMAKQFTMMFSNIGTAHHERVEAILKGRVPETTLLLGKEDRSQGDSVINDLIRSRTIGTYMAELSEVPIGSFLFQFCGKIDLVFKLANLKYAIADLKRSKKLLFELLAIFEAVDGKIVIDGFTAAKSSTVWAYAFQLACYRKLMMLHEYDMSKIGYLIVQHPSYDRPYLLVEIHLDKIYASMIKKGKGPVFSAIIHVDRMCQLRKEFLQEMQETYERTGIEIDETQFQKGCTFLR